MIVGCDCWDGDLLTLFRWIVKHSQERFRRVAALLMHSGSILGE